MKNKIIGVIGAGFVGCAHIRALLDSGYDVRVFDLDNAYANRFYHFQPLPSVDPLIRVINQSDALLICVPTPPEHYKEGTDICGPANTKIVESVLDEISNSLSVGMYKAVCIKSTAPPGFTREMQSRFHNLHLHFSPEFLTEADPLGTLRDSMRVVVGCDSMPNSTLVEALDSINRNNVRHLIKCNTVEAELIKLMSNIFLATKVTLCNTFAKICAHAGANYETVRYGFARDHRIGDSHTQVPGNDGKLGYSGSCFPKDIGNLSAWCLEQGIYTDLFTAVQHLNSEYRKDHDWKDNAYRKNK